MQTKKAIVSVGFDRPEMLALSIKSIQQNPEHKNYDWFCFVDGQGQVQRNFYQEDYPDIKFNIRDRRIGLNANILYAFNELFTFYKYDYIIYVEDDIIVSDDFIRFLEVCLSSFSHPDIFTMSGFARTTPDQYCKGAETVKRLKWYHPWGTLLTQEDFKLIKPHINPYIDDLSGYMRTLGQQIKDIDPSHYEREFSNPAHVNATQDCLINAIRAINGKYQLMPVQSRTQNIGFYGQHQQGEYEGEDLTDVDVQKRACHYTDSFSPHHEWQCLVWEDEVQL